MFPSQKYRTLQNLIPITDFNEQSFLQKVLSAVWESTLEIGCDGFHPLFYHDYEFGDFLVTAFETIGANKSAEICKRALHATFPSGIPQTEQAIAARVGALSEEECETLNHLTDEFNEVNDVYELLYQFARRHPEEFGELADE